MQQRQPFMFSHPHVCYQLHYMCNLLKIFSDPAQWLHTTHYTGCVGRGQAAGGGDDGEWRLVKQQADEQLNFELYRQKLHAVK